MCKKNPLNGGGFPLAYFLCYIHYYLHYGFKISMLLKYDILLAITLLTWLLNIYVCVCVCLNIMTLFYVIIENL